MGNTQNLKEVMFFLNQNYHLLGYRERKVLECIHLWLEENRYTPGVYRIGSGHGSFEFAWDLPGYQKGTVLG